MGLHMAAAATDLDAIADELYALRPDEFAAARDDRVKQLRASGEAALAREIAKLRRPTQTAWLINALWRDQREVMEQLFELADDLARAQAQLSGAELRTLTAQRRQIETALLQRGEVLAAEAGIDVTPAMAREAQDTLAAAFAQPEVADEVRSGRLVKPVAYAGFGGFGVAMPEAGAAQRNEPRRDTEPKPIREDKKEHAEPKQKVIDLQAAQRAKEQERRDRVQRIVDDARASVEVAAEELAERTKAAEEAQARHQELRQRIDELQAELRQAQADAISADKDARTAAHRRDYAEKEHASAVRTLEQAERQLAELK
jgi:hypothetical protein